MKNNLTKISLAGMLCFSVAACSQSTAEVEEQQNEDNVSLEDATYNEVCEEKSRDENTAIYACSAYGYGLVNNLKSNENNYDYNNVTVEINMKDLTVASVLLTNFGDDEKGSSAVTDEALASYEGYSLAGDTNISLTTGATYTSSSIKAMVMDALRKASIEEDPWVYYDTLAEAEEVVGFNISVPEYIEGYFNPVFRVNSDEKIIDVMYLSNSGMISIRKGEGIVEDINENADFTWENTENNSDVEMHGTGGNWYDGTWKASDESYSYGIYISKGVDIDTFNSYIRNIS